MIDYDFEARLVDRIAAREAIAAKLTLRQRRVLCRFSRYGETFSEIAQRENVSTTRINQIYAKALHKLRAPFTSQQQFTPVRPEQPTRNTPPTGFDKAEFLRHMRGLIERRASEERHRLEIEQYELETERIKEFARERAEVARLIAGEKAKNEPPPPLPSLKIKLPVQYTVHPGHYVYNSPSYAPPLLPTADDLSRIAHQALEYLLLTGPQYFAGTPWLGKWATGVVFTRDGGSVSEAVNRIVRELPATARLSAFPVPIEEGTLGANATTPHASLRVTVTPDGLKLRFDVTWD